MQINLKQSEIENALKGYIASQGISLFAKEISISFTAGRKESGISADITIEDGEIPFVVPPTGPINREANVPSILMKDKVQVEQEQEPQQAVVVVGSDQDSGGKSNSLFS